MKKSYVSRALLALVATLLVVWLAAPHGGVTKAQNTDAPSVSQPDAAAPVIQGGPPGRVALNGPWTLRSDSVSRGQIRGWPRGGFVGSKVTVPNATNADRVSGQAGIESFRGTIGWYSTTFTVGADGAYAIRFESVNHRARVWLDGKEIGQHKGTYLPFEFPVKLKAGVAHTLVVRADFRHPNAMKKDGWHRTWFNFGGINREVTVRPLGPSEITAPTVRTRLDGKGGARVDISVHLANRGTAVRTLTTVGALTRPGVKLPFRFPDVSIPPGQTRVLRATVHVPNAKLWAPGSPNLYTLGIAVPGETSYTLKTGLRELGHEGRTLLLNGKPIKMRGASLQEDAEGSGDALTAPEMDKIVSDLKKIGANATRAQHALSPGLLQRLDRAGIAVWQQVGPVDSPGEFDAGTTFGGLERARTQVRADVRAARLHPSVITWSLACEVNGNGAPGQAEFVDGMARELHRTDPGRGVAVDLWTNHEPAVPGPLYADLDAVGVTSYYGWYEDTFASPARQAALVRARVRSLRELLPGKGIVVAELGAEGTRDAAPAQRGGRGYQAALLGTQLNALRTAPGLDGAFVWLLRDFAVNPAFDGGSIVRIDPTVQLLRGLNQKGLFDYAGRAKPAVRVVARALRSFGWGRRP